MIGGIDAESFVLGFWIAILGGIYIIFRMNRGE